MPVRVLIKGNREEEPKAKVSTVCAFSSHNTRCPQPPSKVGATESITTPSLQMRELIISMGGFELRSAQPQSQTAALSTASSVSELEGAFCFLSPSSPLLALLLCYSPKSILFWPLSKNLILLLHMRWYLMANSEAGYGGLKY